MSAETEAAPKSDAAPACQNELADALNLQLEEAHCWATDQYEDGQRVRGRHCVFQFVTAFLHAGIVKGNFLRGRRGFVASSVAAQDAYNRAALVFCMAVRKK